MDNNSLFLFLFGLGNNSQALDSIMIFGAEYIIYVTFILIFILGLKGGVRERKSFLLALIAIPIVVLLIKIIHLFIVEPRPFVAHDLKPLIFHREDASFPSRHTSVMAALAFAYTFYKSKFTILFLILLLWVGISRIYVGVHYPLDIAGGVAVGIISTFIAWQIKKYLGKKLLN